MADVFVSYRKIDRALAEVVVGALGRADLTVWWDNDLSPREAWDAEIEHEISIAKAVLVLWTPASVQPESFVRNEADYAKQAGKLVPALLEPCEIPIAYRRIQYADLRDWRGESAHAGWEKLLRWVAEAGADTTDTSNPRPKSSLDYSVQIDWHHPTVRPTQAGENWRIIKQGNTGDVQLELSISPEQNTPLDLIGKALGFSKTSIKPTFSKIYFGRAALFGTLELGREFIVHQPAFGLDVERGGLRLAMDRPPFRKVGELKHFFPFPNSDSQFVTSDLRRTAIWDLDQTIAVELPTFGDPVHHSTAIAGLRKTWLKLEQNVIKGQSKDKKHDVHQSIEVSPLGDRVADYFCLIESHHNMKLVLRLWQLEKGYWDKPRSIEIELSSNFTESSGVFWSPSGNWLFFVGLRGRLHSMFNSSNLESLVLPDASDSRSHLSNPSFHSKLDKFVVATGRGVAVGGYWRIEDQRIVIFDCDSASSGREFQSPHSKQIVCLNWSPCGRYVASASRDTTLGILDLFTGQTQIHYGDQTPVAGVWFSPDGQRLLVQDLGGKDRISIWDHVAGQELTSWSGNVERFPRGPWHPNGQMIGYTIDPHTVAVRQLS